MTDRELLEAAARAAGIAYDARYITPENVMFQGLLLPTETRNTKPKWWNPLTDDGDALRLAVRLGLLVYVFHEPPMTCIRLPGEHVGGKYDKVELHAKDPYAATRRAIVRAAAQIGEGMA